MEEELIAHRRYLGLLKQAVLKLSNIYWPKGMPIQE